MTAEQLNIKIKLDISDIKSGIEKVKKSISGMNDEVKKGLPKISSESKKAKQSLEDVSEASDDVKESLQKVGTEATSSLSKIKQMVAGIRSGGGFGDTFRIDASGADYTNASLEEMQGTMEMIRNLSFFELMSHGFGKLKEGSQKVRDAKDEMERIKKEMEELNLKIAEGRKKWNSFFEGLENGSEVSADSIMDLHNESRGFIKTEKELLENLGLATDKLGKAQKGFMLMKVAIMAVVAAVAALVATISSLGISKLGKEIYDNAQMAGMSSINYQKWAFQLERAGIQAEELREIVKTLTEAQVDVINGEEDMIAAFQQLGISQQEVINMNQEQLFARTVAGLQGIENMTQRTAIAYKLFSEDATKLTQILNMSKEDAARLSRTYNQLGGSMSYNLVQLSAKAQNAVYNLKTAFMGIRNSLAEALLPVITWVITKLTQLFAIINMVLRVLFGIDLSAGPSNGLTGGFISGGEAAEDYAGSVDDATAAVEKFRRVTMGFDELNILGGNVSSSGSSSSGGDSGSSIPDYGGGTGGSDPLIPVEDLGLDKIQAWIEKYKLAIQDFATVGLMTLGIGMVIAGVLGGFNLPMITGGIALAGLGIAIGSVEGGTFDRWGDKLKTWWGTFKTWCSTNIMPVFTKDYWKTKWDNIKEAASEKLDIIKTAISTKWDAIKTWFGEHVKPVFTKDYWVNKWNSIKDGAAEMWGKFKETAFYKFITNTAKNLTANFTAHFKEKGEKVRKIVTAAIKLFKSGTATLTAWFKEKGASVRKSITSTWTLAKTATRILTAKFKASGAYKTIEKYWNKFKSGTHTIKVMFQDAFTAKIKSSWNGLVTAINSAIGLINKIPKVNIPKLPYLATGGIVTSATTAVIGEAGREAVLPLDRNTGWMDVLADKIAGRSGGTDTPVKIILNVDGRQLGWATIDNINKITKQSGELQLVLG